MSERAESAAGALPGSWRRQVPPPTGAKPAGLMSDRWTYLLAAGAAAGAAAAVPGPRLVALGCVLGALALRRPLLLCAAAAMLASFGAAAAVSDLSAAVEPGRLQGRIVLVSDPTERNGATRAVADTPRGRMEVWGWGGAGARLSRLAAGQRVEVAGRVAQAAGYSPRLAGAGAVGRLTLSEVGDVHPGAPHYRLANALRGVLARGAASLPDDQRALFSGLVLGDDRDRSPLTADDFRGAGLTHLLAVSGQNVAFVLLVVQPVVVRLGLWGRWLATLAVLGLFATVTRFEPSVLRATVMAAVAVSVWLAGRRVSGRRILALAVAGLLVAQPLLVHSLAFRLSVAASAGILFWAPRLAERIGGPRPLAQALAVTAAAQLAVAPLVIPVFGGLPVAALPANLLAAPAAAAVMMWGLTGGFVAGLVGEPAAAALHAPTRGLLMWIEGTAATFTGLGLGQLRMAHVLLIGAALAVVVAARRRRGAVLAAWVAIAAVLAAPLLAERSGPANPVALAVGWESTLWQSPRSAVLLLGGRESAERLLGDIRLAGAERIDLIVATDGGAAAASHVGVLRRRYGPAVVWAPEQNRIAGASVPAAGSAATVGDFVVRVESEARPLAVAVHAASGGG
ncbi:MAG: ComEC/Rec2 family competence protein [bacterium]|nr:ComEC/Rec2 family competence protein [bacterium]